MDRRQSGGQRGQARCQREARTVGRRLRHRRGVLNRCLLHISSSSSRLSGNDDGGVALHRRIQIRRGQLGHLFAIEIRVQCIVAEQHTADHKQPFVPEMSEVPEEGDARQESEKQRRVSDGSQAAANVAHQEDENTESVLEVRPTHIR